LREEIKAGIIITASIIVLTAFIVLIGGGRFLDKFDVYHVNVMNAAGLETGAQVRLGGVRAGRVLAINAPDGPGKPITIDLGIKKGTILYKGTKALITQVGFVGDIYLLLSVDNTTTGQIAVGETIPSEEQVQFGKLMARMDTISQSVDNLVKDVNVLFSHSNMQEIKALLGNTNKAIVSGSSNLDRIAASLKATTDKLQLVLNEIEDVMKSNKGEVSHVIRKARESLEKAGDMIKAIEETAKTVDKTTKSIDKAVDVQSQNLDALFNTLTKTTEDMQDVLNEIKNKPWSVIYRESDRKEE